MEIHIEGTMYRVSYGGYNLWRLIYMLKCMETYIEGTMYGEAYRGYKLWTLI